MMEHVDLGGEWSLAYGPQQAGAPERPEELAKSGWPVITARVPGNVELDLMEAGKLPRELWRGNTIYQLRPWEYYRWWYRRRFAMPELPPGHRAVLVLEGVDCIAQVYLNGVELGECRNMLIAHRFDITELVRFGGENQLQVRIDSAVLEGRKHRPDAVEYAATMNWESLSVRKAPHTFGWDILPRIVSAGLWRGVRVEIVPPTRFEDVYWATLAVDAEKCEAEVLVSWHIATDVADIEGWQVQVQLYRNKGCVHRSQHPVLATQGRARLKLSDVDLWWPRGCGKGDEAALHNAGIQLLDRDGNKLAEHHIRLGIRKAELRRTDVTDEQGSGEFVFVVNGRRIYCRGTNHVPVDSLHSRDAQNLSQVLPLLRDLNCNMVRCWGGNVYEDHAFFDYCDKYGIMVWQDFAMACAVYPQTDEFAREIRQEAQVVVRKLRNHCSLVLWAGNNEIDQAYGWSGLGLDPNSDVLSRRVLPEVVRRLDPYRSYLPSSPYYSPELHRVGNYLRRSPEDHLWGPRDDFKGPYYTNAAAHFVSETGYHGCPCHETMEAMMEPDALWPWQGNEQWLTHSVRSHPMENASNYRIELMAKQIRVIFDRDPQTLDEYILASQTSQAEAVKYFIERWRMGKWRRTGMLWWNVRDGWPVFSDAVVDYFGRKKLAYEVIRRVQADVCVSIGEPQADARGGVHDVVLVNDLDRDVKLRITVRDVELGRVLFEGNAEGKADTSMKVGRIEAAAKPAMWLIEWSGDGVAGRNHYLAGPRPFVLEEYRRWLEGVGLDWRSAVGGAR